MDTISARAASRNEPRVDVLSGPRSLLDEGMLNRWIRFGKRCDVGK